MFRGALRFCHLQVSSRGKNWSCMDHDRGAGKCPCCTAVLEIPCSSRHSLVSMCNTTHSNTPAKDESCRTQKQIILSSGSFNPASGRPENCGCNMELNGEVTMNSFSWFQAISINPGVTTEAGNLNNHSPSSAARKGSHEHWISNHGLWDPTWCKSQTSIRLCSGSEVR